MQSGLGFRKRCRRAGMVHNHVLPYLISSPFQWSLQKLASQLVWIFREMAHTRYSSYNDGVRLIPPGRPCRRVLHRN